MHPEIGDRLRSAHLLCQEAKKSGLDYGCVETALHALGGSANLVDLLKGNPTDFSSLLDVIYRSGFIPSWIFSITNTMNGNDFETILEGKVSSEVQPRGKLAGHLGLASYNSANRMNHVIAILPRQHFPRDQRRQLKKDRSYVIFDAGAGGLLQIPTIGLAKYSQQVNNQGGQFSIAQLRK